MGRNEKHTVTVSVLEQRIRSRCHFLFLICVRTSPSCHRPRLFVGTLSSVFLQNLLQLFSQCLLPHLLHRKDFFGRMRRETMSEKKRKAQTDLHGQPSQKKFPIESRESTITVKYLSNPDIAKPVIGIFVILSNWPLARHI